MRRNPYIIAFVVALSCVAGPGCVSSSEDADTSKFFEPESYGTDEEVECRTECVLPAGTLDFAPPDVPVKLHFGADVAPLQLSRWDEVMALDRDKRYTFTVSGWSERHRDSAPYIDTILGSRDTFIGLGGPFIDDYLHLFQCRSHDAGEPIWKFDHYYLYCEWAGRVTATFPTEPSSSDPTRPMISERFREWIRHIPVGHADPDRRLRIYTYVRDRSLGFSWEVLPERARREPRSLYQRIPEEDSIEPN